MSETVFTKIIRGEIPCHRVWEDERVFAFLDIAPLAPGHVLVVPKEPAPTLDALSEESAAAIGRVLPRIARAVVAVTGTRDFNVLQNNGAAAHQVGTAGGPLGAKSSHPRTGSPTTASTAQSPRPDARYQRAARSSLDEVISSPLPVICASDRATRPAGSVNIVTRRGGL